MSFSWYLGIKISTEQNFNCAGLQKLMTGREAVLMKYLLTLALNTFSYARDTFKYFGAYRVPTS